METIFLTDTPKQIKKKIGKAFSGGKESVELHRELGGNPDIDVSFKYLTFFMPDNDKLDEIKEKYSTGKMLTGELKAICIETIVPIILHHQKVRKEIDDKQIKKFMSMKSSL